MRKLFLPISVLIVIYLVYFYLLWFISFYAVEENQFAFFSQYFLGGPNIDMTQLRVVNVLLGLLSLITFVLALKRSRKGKPAVLRLLIGINIFLVLLAIVHLLAEAF